MYGGRGCDSKWLSLLKRPQRDWGRGRGEGQDWEPGGLWEMILGDALENLGEPLMLLLWRIGAGGQHRYFLVPPSDTWGRPCHLCSGQVILEVGAGQSHPLPIPPGPVPPCPASPCGPRRCPCRPFCLPSTPPALLWQPSPFLVHLPHSHIRGSPRTPRPGSALWGLPCRPQKHSPEGWGTGCGLAHSNPRG